MWIILYFYLSPINSHVKPHYIVILKGFLLDNMIIDAIAYNSILIIWVVSYFNANTYFYKALYIKYPFSPFHCISLKLHFGQRASLKKYWTPSKISISITLTRWRKSECFISVEDFWWSSLDTASNHVILILDLNSSR